MNRKKPQEFYSEADQLFDKQAFIESIKDGFREVEDPRVADHQSYPLAYLLVMIVCAILAGANTIIAIHTYAVIKLGMFDSWLGIERAPSYNVFWWLLTRLSPQQFENCLVRWIQALPEEDKERLIAIDDKRLRARCNNLYLPLRRHPSGLFYSFP